MAEMEKEINETPAEETVEETAMEEAVNEEIKLTSLYEYFMYSLPEDYNRPLPQLVTLYFGYNSGISNDKLAIVYENLLIYKDDMEQVYKANYGQVERFASKSLEAGLIDEHFSTIYKEVLKKAMIIPEIANVLPKLANTYFIKVEQDNIKEIEVVHKETKEVSVYPVVNKKAYVQIYTEDAAVIFVDINGVGYGKSVNCTKVKLLDMEEYLDKEDVKEEIKENIENEIENQEVIEEVVEKHWIEVIGSILKTVPLSKAVLTKGLKKED